MMDLYKKAIDLAEQWQYEVENSTKRSEKKEQQKYKSLASDKQSKNLLVIIFDRSFRSFKASKVVTNFHQILSDHGVPSFFRGIDRLLIKIFLQVGYKFPRIALPLLKRKIRLDTAKVVLPAKGLSKYLINRREQGFRVNLNQLGEAVLGETEAKKHLADYLVLLDSIDIDYISIKLSNIFSELHPLGFTRSKQILKERLSTLYDRAKSARLPSKSQGKHKFINLDMEEYKDVELTLQVFMETLSQEKFNDLSAGIVLQAYLPCSYHNFKRLVKWAKQRVDKGGSPIKVRLVKGANLSVELVQSSLVDLASPIFPNKLLSDANYKKILDLALKPQITKYVKLGVASHNMFDLAYAKVVATHHGTLDSLTFEMLDGMAEPLVRVLKRRGGELILYSPFAEPECFLNAIGYLVRRLDENTQMENFLRHSFNMKLGSDSWKYLKKQFLRAQELKSGLKESPYRDQDRQKEQNNFKERKEIDFVNEPETDFHLPQNILWADKIKEEFKKSVSVKQEEILAQVGKEDVKTSEVKDYADLNQAPAINIYKIHRAGVKEIDHILSIADKATKGWSSKPLKERWLILKKVAGELRKNRGSLIGCVAQTTGKVFIEADAEINEAIDFLEYYPYSLNKLAEQTLAEFKGKGVVLVIAPWNFPLAIPIGGVAAALAGGNSVILKPAPEAAVIAYKFAQLFWQAGVPREVFQVACPSESERVALERLVKSDIIKHIIFTGGTDTAQKIIKTNYKTLLSAETGGKNTTIITEMADIDIAIKNVVHSAFSNGGQKCSCTSLLILEKSLYESEFFKNKLLDCAKSFKSGSAWQLGSDYGPLIAPPSGKLKLAIEKNNPGETWFIKPETSKDNPRILTPGIKWGIKRGSFMHKTELFGPILGVMCADDISEAIDIANDTDYGLTAGLESLDEKEQTLWLSKIRAGNLYINRNTVGAVVQRQPFGGMKESSFGAGAKAGGANYAMQFCIISEPDDIIADDINSPLSDQKKETNNGLIDQLPNFTDKIAYLNHLKEYQSIFKNEKKSFFSYQWAMQNHFKLSLDVSNLLGQDNIAKYLTGVKIAIRFTAKDDWGAGLRAILAAVVCQADLLVSFGDDFKNNSLAPIKEFLNAFYVFYQEENITEFLRGVRHHERVRYLSPESASDEEMKTAAALYTPISNHVPYKSGRLELVNYLQEQSISNSYHRYGNLGLRGD
ncbi:MAG: proline dehydrogenase family protein [SAR324 cluster bacterium]|nr:proline dehydrogenase family protein [SAR324 cluster bacterium]